MAAQPMHHRPIAGFLVPVQQSPHLSCRDHQLGRLGLPNALGLQIPPHYQPVSIPSGHGENSLFLHLPSLIRSTEYFYSAQTGHSHLAPTCPNRPLTPALPKYTISNGGI